MEPKQHRCETCRLRALAEKKPQSLLARHLALAHRMVPRMEVVSALAGGGGEANGRVRGEQRNTRSNMLCRSDRL